MRSVEERNRDESKVGPVFLNSSLPLRCLTYWRMFFKLSLIPIYWGDVRLLHQLCLMYVNLSVCWMHGYIYMYMYIYTNIDEVMDI